MGQIERHGELFEVQQRVHRLLSGGQRGRRHGVIFGGAVAKFAEHKRGDERLKGHIRSLASDPHQETDPDQ